LYARLIKKGPIAPLAVAIIIAACNSPAAIATPTPSPTPIASATTVATATSGPAPTIGKIVPFPDLTFIVGTITGDLYFQIKDGQPAGRKVHVCTGAVRDLVAYGRKAAFVCGSPGDQTLYVYDDATGTLAAVAKTEMSWPGFAFTSTGGLVYVTMGAEVATAPIAMSKLVHLDLKTGATTTIDERFGVAFGVWLSSGGVAIWRPQNSLSFARPEAEAGTWLLRDKTLSRLSLFRLVAGYEGRYLLESEPRDGSGYAAGFGGSTYVVLRTDREMRLTPSDVASEQAVEVLPDGRIFTWRPQNGPFDGRMVLYRDGIVQRQDLGTFSTLKLLHVADWTTHTSDWIIGYEISGAGPQYWYRAYRFSDGAFASIPAGNITSLGFLGPNN
jgi:hypothetical protein